MTAAAAGPAELVRVAVDAFGRLLGPLPAEAGGRPAMGSTVREVVGHVADCLAFYAHDLVAGRSEVTAGTFVARPGADLPSLAASVGAWGEVLARVVAVSPADERGWHPHGLADAAGFAGMGCAEVLLHGHDVAAALDAGWSPPRDVAAFVLARLFPQAEPAGDPWTTLLWATGRLELPGRETVREWRYSCAPPGG